MALCTYVGTRNALPRLVALVAAQEEKDDYDEQVCVLGALRLTGSHSLYKVAAVKCHVAKANATASVGRKLPCISLHVQLSTASCFAQVCFAWRYYCYTRVSSPEEDWV